MSGLDKVVTNYDDALRGITNDMILMVGGFGLCGIPEGLIQKVADVGVKGITCISNNAGVDGFGLGRLLEKRQIKTMIGSYVGENKLFEELFLSGEMEVILTPQGTLAEKIRATGAGIPAFYTATAVGTPLAKGKEEKVFNNKKYILEEALSADFAFIKADVADRYGNLTFNKTARNFNPIMCMAAKQSLIQTKKIIEPDETNPEHVITPGIFVQKIIQVENPIIESNAIEEGIIYP